uniref:Uncharacterized protein n=1 Tax=Steinernema glaseri TaxID=37863 RepID=A0A1I8A189_9BILA
MLREAQVANERRRGLAEGRRPRVHSGSSVPEGDMKVPSNSVERRQTLQRNDMKTAICSDVERAQGALKGAARANEPLQRQEQGGRTTNEFEDPRCTLEDWPKTMINARRRRVMRDEEDCKEGDAEFESDDATETKGAMLQEVVEPELAKPERTTYALTMLLTADLRVTNVISGPILDL